MSYPENYQEFPKRVWCSHDPIKGMSVFISRECETSPEMEYVRRDLYEDSVALEDAVRHHYANEAMYHGILKQVADAIGEIAYTDRDGNWHNVLICATLPQIVSQYVQNKVMPECVRVMRDHFEQHVPGEEVSYYEHQDVLQAVDDYYNGNRNWRQFNEKRRDHIQGWQRYEKLRKLNPRQFGDLWDEALKGDKRFDDLVDDLP